MTKKLTKGLITVSLALTVGAIIIGGVATFYTTTNATNKEIGKTNERVSVVETQVASILKSQERVEESIAEVVKILMQQ